MKWISVKTKLPENENGIILFYNDIIGFGWYSLVKNIFYSGAYTRDVSHWMPLPEKPQTDEK